MCRQVQSNAVASRDSVTALDQTSQPRELRSIGTSGSRASTVGILMSSTRVRQHAANGHHCSLCPTRPESYLPLRARAAILFDNSAIDLALALLRAYAAPRSLEGCA